jgi:DNA-binding transcriptional regulator YiaG
MKPELLKTHRESLGLKIAEMAIRLQTPYRTYQDWENGSRRIPGICCAAVQMLLERDKAFMDRIKKGTLKK